jgi:5-methylcytosine-specific restriction enzyme A
MREGDMPLLYHWRRENYRADLAEGSPGYKLHQRSARLHGISQGESVWAFTRNSEDLYVLACELIVVDKYKAASSYGFYGVRGDPSRSRYFDVVAGPSVEPLIRGIVDVKTAALGSSFQGGAAVRVLSPHDDQCLRAFATDLPLLETPKSKHLRNPDWSRDELILALDLYLRHRAGPPSKTSREVAELSRTLARLASQRGVTIRSDYRNANGVYMKMMNFRRFDPEYTDGGKVGLQRGNALEEGIWNDFSVKPAELYALAQLIRDAVDTNLVLPLIEGEAEADEGVEYVLHRRLERDSGIAKRKKQQVLSAKGTLTCEVCEFDFRVRYGARGDGFIECHHTNALALRKVRSKTKLSDLALVCSNCHRMIHAKEPWLGLDELQALLQ